MLVFWFSAFLVLYVYFGYPLLVWLLKTFVPNPVSKGAPSCVLSPVSVIIAARNEGDRIEKKICNIIAQEYPQELLEIIVISDGSIDNTNAKIRRVAEKNSNIKIELIQLDNSQGKPNALNIGIERAEHEFIVFTDCRQTFEPDVIRQLIANFDDPAVGSVSGELKFWRDSTSQIQAEMGLYWKYEKFIRKAESQSGSVVGATGAIYAIRKSLFMPLPHETLIDDVLIPLNIAAQGRRVIFDSTAVAYDVVSDDMTKEWHRKVRTLAGNWQLLQLFPGLLNPFVNPLWWRFLSHKFLRLLVPFALIAMFLSSFSLNSWFFQLVLFFQIIIYLFMVAAHFYNPLKRNKIVKTAYFFGVLNLAVLVGFVRWATKTHVSTWQVNAGGISKKGGVPVLMYHALEDDEHPAGYTEPGDKVYVLQVEQFREQMAYLKDNGFRTYLIDELLEMDCLPEKAVVLTFDDGHVSNATLALPILQEYGFKAHFFITTGRIGTPYFLTAEQIGALYDAGMGIGSHGVTHRFLNVLSENDARAELVNSKNQLQEIIGKTITGISYPGGREPKISTTDYFWQCNSSIGFLKNLQSQLFQRVPIKYNTILSDFVNIIQCDQSYYQRAQLREKVLFFMKRALGDKGYAAIHRMLAR